jgi:3-deoxy-D-manno-octulosonic-acid transferase
VTMYALYNLLLAPADFAVTPALHLPRFRAHRERLGLYPADLVARLGGRKVLWLHNASVGELLASRPLLARLRKALGDWRIVLSTTSLSGKDLAGNIREADGAVLLPLDFPGAVERALDTLRPSLFVFTETEIWPNLLRALERRGTPAVMVSGRVSPKAFRRYRWVRRFLRRVLAGVSLFAMQSEEEAARIRALGAPPDRVRVTGSLKLDPVVSDRTLAIDRGARLFIAASTHAGEEDACVGAFRRLRGRFPDLRLLLAPRHLGRLAEVEDLLRRTGLAYVRRTGLVSNHWNGDPPVLLLDTLGELSGLYEGAAAAFVGGTLAPVGGHNLLEPALAAVPVLFGPNVANVSEVAAALDACGGGIRVRDADELERALERLLEDPEAARRAGGAAARAFSSSTSVDATFHAVVECLGDGDGGL